MNDTRGSKKRPHIVSFKSETLPKIDPNKKSVKTNATESKLRVIKSDANIRMPLLKPTANKPSTLRYRSPLKTTNDKTRIKQAINNKQPSNKKQLATHKTTENLTLSKENKSPIGLETLQSQANASDENEVLSGTITSNLGETIGSQRETMNETITSELGTTIDSNRSLTNRIGVETTSSKADLENQETLNLLSKIRHSAHALRIGPTPLSQQSCRFELPFDLKILETLTPLDYLSKYCRLSPRRQYQFKRMFDRYRNRRYQFESSSLYLSIVDIHRENFTRPKFDYLCQLIDLGTQEHHFTFETYAGILALCERILYNSSTLHSGYEDFHLTRDTIENCDFYSLVRKLDGLQISETMKRLLSAL